MRKFWIKFDVKCGQGNYVPILGCGVTAESLGDALKMCKMVVCKGNPLPPLLAVIEDVELAVLDQKHVIPNIGEPNQPGVWFRRTTSIPRVHYARKNCEICSLKGCAEAEIYDNGIVDQLCE